MASFRLFSVFAMVPSSVIAVSSISKSSLTP
jgi:hypothetical protein